MNKNISAYLWTLTAYLGTYILFCLAEYCVSKIPVIGAFLFYPYYGYSEIGYQAYIIPFMVATIVSYRVLFCFQNVSHAKIVTGTAITIIVIGLISLFLPEKLKDDLYIRLLFILSGIIYWCFIDFVPKLRRWFGHPENREKRY